jgi:hypothetical protein
MRVADKTKSSQNLWFERHAFAGANQFAPFDVKHMIFKNKPPHSIPPRQPSHSKIKMS